MRVDRRVVTEAHEHRNVPRPTICVNAQKSLALPRAMRVLPTLHPLVKPIPAMAAHLAGLHPSPDCVWHPLRL